MRKISLVQICWFIIGLLLLAGGIYAEVGYVGDIVTLSEPLGLIMLVAGWINFLMSLWKRNIIHGSRWLIADGLCAMLLSLFPLLNEMILPIMIPFFFGMWELFSGILKVMDSTELRAERIKCWLGIAIIGAVELVSGTLSLVKPIDDFVGINNVISIIFIVQSCGFILKAMMYKQLIQD